MTEPCLKAVASRCCDRHDALNHLARAIGLEEYADGVVRSTRGSQEAHWRAPVDRYPFVTPPLRCFTRGAARGILLPGWWRGCCRSLHVRSCFMAVRIRAAS